METQFHKLIKSIISSIEENMDNLIENIKDELYLTNKVRVNLTLNNPSKSVKILIADDEKITLSSLAMMIYSMGYTPITVHSGRETIKLIKDNPGYYSVILLDMMMPDKNGDEVLKETRDIISKYKTPVIIQTGYYQSTKTKEYLSRLGVTSFINKPYDIKAVQNIVNSCLIYHKPQSG